MGQYCKIFLDDYNKKHFKKKGRRISQINSNSEKQDNKRSNENYKNHSYYYTVIYNIQ